MDSILIDMGLVKNVIGIIIDYLTDPPYLPYIDELKKKTYPIARETDWCYNRYYIQNNSYRINHRTRISIYSNIWYVHTY